VTALYSLNRHMSKLKLRARAARMTLHRPACLQPMVLAREPAPKHQPAGNAGWQYHVTRCFTRYNNALIVAECGRAGVRRWQRLVPAVRPSNCECLQSMQPCTSKGQLVSDLIS
jgi:hypothetical protein